MCDLRVYAEGLGGEVKHYRDNSGLECDAVVHLEDGRWGGIEIKLGGAYKRAFPGETTGHVIFAGRRLIVEASPLEIIEYRFLSHSLTSSSKRRSQTFLIIRMYFNIKNIL